MSLFFLQSWRSLPTKSEPDTAEARPKARDDWIWWMSYTYIKLHVPYIQHDVLMWGSLFAQPHCGFFQPSAAWTHLGHSWSHHDGNLLDLRCWKSELMGNLTKHWKIIPKDLSRNPIVYSLRFDVCWRLLYFNSPRNHSNPKFWWFFWAESPLTDHLDMCLLDSSCGFQKHLPTT